MIKVRTMKMVRFEVTPIGKPRMVRSDIWSGRKCVAEYWRYKDELNILARQNRFKIGDTLHICFYLPMPFSWSQKKKDKMENTPHQQKPDIDNLLKGFVDSLTENDQNIHSVVVLKKWAKTGYIEIMI